MPRMEGSLKDLKQKETLTSDILFSLIYQLLDMDELLKTKNMNHNDVKPGNILYEKKKRQRNGQYKIRITLADFGMCGRFGGTPGWSPPNFTHDRQRGSDEYSFGLCALYLLAEDDELFYVLRDNYISEQSPLWLVRFRDLPEIKIICMMLDPNNQQSSKSEWDKLRLNIQRITRQRLVNLGVPFNCLKLQNGNTTQDKNK